MSGLPTKDPQLAKNYGEFFFSDILALNFLLSEIGTRQKQPSN